MGESGFLIIFLVVLMGFGVFFMNSNNLIVNRILKADVNDLASINVNKANYKNVASKLSKMVIDITLDTSHNLDTSSLDKYKKIESLLNSVISLDPSDNNAQIMLGLIQNKIGQLEDYLNPNDPDSTKNYENSVANLTKNPSQPGGDSLQNIILADSLLHLCQKYANSKDKVSVYANQAIETFNKIMSGSLKDNAYKQLYAITALNLGNVESQINPSFALNYYQLAQNTLQSILTSEPNDVGTKLELANVYTNIANYYLINNNSAIAMNNFNQSGLIYQELLAHNPKSFDIMNNYVSELSQLGKVHEMQNNKLEASRTYTQALDLCNQMLALKPNDMTVKTNITNLTDTINNLK